MHPYDCSSDGIKEYFAAEPKPVVTLRTSVIVGDDEIWGADEEYVEQKVRESLALKLAKWILDEDLICIVSNHYIDKEETVFKAELKVIQE